MVRNVKVLEGKEYTTRKIRKIIIDQEESESREDRNIALKQKNRQSAQKSRDNKKKYIVSLQLKVAQLQLENEELKQRVESCSCHKKVEEVRFPHSHIRHFSHQQILNGENEENNEQTESGGDTFQRLSERSFVSCGNFLMLALIAICCVLGFLQDSVSVPNYKSLYSVKTLKDIFQTMRTNEELDQSTIQFSMLQENEVQREWSALGLNSQFRANSKVKSILKQNIKQIQKL